MSGQLAVRLDDGRTRPAPAGRERGAGGRRDLVVLAPGVPHAYTVEPGARHWRLGWARCQARPSWTPWLHPHCTGDGPDGLYAVGPVPAALHDRVEGAWRRMHADARWAGGEVPAGDPGIVVAHGSAAIRHGAPPGAYRDGMRAAIAAPEGVSKGTPKGTLIQ